MLARSRSLQPYPQCALSQRKNRCRNFLRSVRRVVHQCCRKCPTSESRQVCTRTHSPSCCRAVGSTPLRSVDIIAALPMITVPSAGGLLQLESISKLAGCAQVSTEQENALCPRRHHDDQRNLSQTHSVHDFFSDLGVGFAIRRSIQPPCPSSPCTLHRSTDQP